MAAAIPDLQRNHDRLLVFADEGNVVALIAWPKVHQLDLMANEETRKHGIAFEVDFNNHETVDISIKLDLTERVAVKTGEAGCLDIQHLAEIQHMPAYADEFWKLYAGETLLAEWGTPSATPSITRWQSICAAARRNASKRSRRRTARPIRRASGARNSRGRMDESSGKRRQCLPRFAPPNI